MGQESLSVVALRDAVNLIGSQAAFARLINVTQQAVSQMLARKRSLPAQHVLKVEEATGISRHALRPDIYPAEPEPAADRYNGVRA